MQTACQIADAFARIPHPAHIWPVQATEAPHEIYTVHLSGCFSNAFSGSCTGTKLGMAQKQDDFREEARWRGW